MSLLTELGLPTYVEPLPNPSVTRETVVSAYLHANELVNLRTDRMDIDEEGIRIDHFASRRILELFEEGKTDLRDGILTSQSTQTGKFWIPMAGETQIGLPMGPVIRACDRQIRDSLDPPLNSAKARDLNYLRTFLYGYSTSTLLEIEGTDWTWIAHKIAHELSLYAPGQDDLDTWDRAIRFLEGPVLMLPA